MIERNILKSLRENLENDYILILVGARQVGKTTVLKELITELEGAKKEAKFLTLEDPSLLYDLNEHPKNIFNYVREPKEKEKTYLFIDEIQYLDNPSNFLKYIYDLFADKIKLIVTGSSAFYIDTKFKDSLAGRKKIFRLFGFSFSEFLRAKGKSEHSNTILNNNYFKNVKKRRLLKPEKQELKQLFLEYSAYGSYPRVVLSDTVEEKQEYLRELYTSFLKKDVYDAGLEDHAKFYNLLKILASQVGKLVNKNELSSTLKLSQNTVSKYLYVLEKSFIINLSRPFYRNIRKELTKMPKVFFLDNGFRNAVLDYFTNFPDRVDSGETFENIFYTELNKLNLQSIKFWRTQAKAEIDFIVEDKYAFELKLSKQSFNKNKYMQFTKNYIDISLNLIVPFDSKELDILDFTS